MCLAIIHLYFKRTFSFALSAFVSSTSSTGRQKVKTDKKRIFISTEKTTLAEVSNFISLKVYLNIYFQFRFEQFSLYHFTFHFSVGLILVVVVIDI